MEKVKEQVLKKIKKDLNTKPQREFYWDSLGNWLTYINALFDFGLLTKEEAKNLLISLMRTPFKNRKNCFILSN